MENELIALYLAQSSITAVLTGGIYSYKALGLRGLVPDNPLCPDAFEDINGLKIIRPCLVVRENTDTPTGARVDKPTGAVSSDATVSHWFYQHEFYDQIEIASGLVFDLIKYKVFPDIGYIRPLTSRHGLIAPEYDDVSLHIDDYIVKRVKR